MVARRAGGAPGFTGTANLSQPRSGLSPGGYGDGMTSEPGESGREPTNLDLLAAIGARFDLVDARHLEVLQALDALASMAHAHQAEFGRVEARLTSRLEDMQRVMQATKADLAAHDADPGAHPHGHAA